MLYASAHTGDGVGLNPGLDVGAKTKATNLDPFLTRERLELRRKLIDLSLKLDVAILGSIDLFSLLDPVTDRIGGEACTGRERQYKKDGTYDPA